MFAGDIVRVAVAVPAADGEVEAINHAAVEKIVVVPINESDEFYQRQQPVEISIDVATLGQVRY